MCKGCYIVWLQTVIFVEDIRSYSAQQSLVVTRCPVWESAENGCESPHKGCHVDHTNLLNSGSATVLPGSLLVVELLLSLKCREVCLQFLGEVRQCEQLIFGYLGLPVRRLDDGILDVVVNRCNQAHRDHYIVTESFPALVQHVARLAPIHYLVVFEEEFVGGWLDSSGNNR